jgi:hypothetical protein
MSGIVAAHFFLMKLTIPFTAARFPKNAFNFCDCDGWRSLRSAFASIWRMRSRVTAKCSSYLF